MAMITHRRLWFGAAAVAVAAIIILRLAGGGAVVSVRAARVTRGTLDVWVQSNGRANPIQPHILRARLATFVTSVDVIDGQQVKRGQRLLSLDDTSAQAQLAQAREDLLQAREQLRIARAGGPPDQVAQVEGDLQKTRAELTKLRQDHDALQKLLAEQAATRDEVQQNALALARAQATERVLEAKLTDLKRVAGLDAEAAQLRIAHAQALIQTLGAQVEASEVRSPADGTVYLLPVRAGAYVQVGDELAAVADLRQMQIDAYVDEPDLGSLAVGQPVQITWDAAPGQIWPGRTERLPKTVVARGNRNVGQVLCTVDNDRSPALLPNVNVDVRIQIHERRNVLQVPRGAVRGDGPDRYVLVIEDGVLKRQAIQVGVGSVTTYEVLGGLRDGQLVAVLGDKELRAGMHVSVSTMEPS